MTPSKHLISALILAAILYPLFNWKVIFIVAGGFLIDIDHYLWYIFRHKSINILECYKFFIAHHKHNNFDESVGILLIFHNLEFLLVMAFLSLYSEIAMLFLFGLILHYSLDLVWLSSVPKRFLSSPSILKWLLNKSFK
jgi:hypothetical protein